MREAFELAHVTAALHAGSRDAVSPGRFLRAGTAQSSEARS